ncbi:MAG: MBL fold metallo-hydrolase [Prevotella sp.]|nr:MBL fold metallo-hydrolase [Prevotella sp.]
MRLVILGSSSKGNCYLLDNGRECLMLECGVDLAETERALDFDISRIRAVAVTHEHGDHARYIRRCIALHLPVYCSRGTAEALELSYDNTIHALPAFAPVSAGGFKLMAFPTRHDAAEPFGFLISHPDCGTVLFATDTYLLPYKFAGLNNILIECNYRDDLLERNIYAERVTPAARKRIVKSHMSYETCIETLQENDLRTVNSIVLIHLSDGNSNAEEFRRGVSEATGKRVTVADKGVIIDPFNVTPF